MWPCPPASRTSRLPPRPPTTLGMRYPDRPRPHHSSVRTGPPTRSRAARSRSRSRADRHPGPAEGHRRGRAMRRRQPGHPAVGATRSGGHRWDRDRPAPRHPARDAGTRAGRRRPRPDRRAARPGQAHGARTPRAAPRRRLVPGDGRPRDPPRDRLRPGRPPVPGRRGGRGLRQDQRPAGRRVRAGLHRPRRLVLDRAVEQDQPHPGPRARERRAAHRAQRLGRCADPGGRREPRRVRRGVRAQRPLVGRHPPDLGHPRPVRGWRRLLARAHGLRRDGPRHELDVPHRPRRRGGRDRRAGDDRGARRPGGARGTERRGAPRRRLASARRWSS